MSPTCHNNTVTWSVISKNIMNIYLCSKTNSYLITYWPWTSIWPSVIRISYIWHCWLIRITLIVIVCMMATILPVMISNMELLTLVYQTSYSIWCRMVLPKIRLIVGVESVYCHIFMIRTFLYFPHSDSHHLLE